MKGKGTKRKNLRSYKRKRTSQTGGYITLSPTTKTKNLLSYLDFAILTEEGAIELESLQNTLIVLYRNRRKINRSIELLRKPLENKSTHPVRKFLP